MDIRTETEEIFRKKFKIPDDKHVFLCDMSPGILIEIIIASTRSQFYECAGKQHIMTKALIDIFKYHARVQKAERFYLIQYDETVSKLQLYNSCSDKKVRLLYGDIGFPYYDYQEYPLWIAGFDFLDMGYCSVMVTNQQMYESYNIFHWNKKGFSSLNLANILDRDSNFLVYNDLRLLRKKLITFNAQEFWERIDYNRELLEESLGDGGEGPIFLYKEHIPPELIDKYYIKETEHGTHINLYKNSAMELEELCDTLKSV